MKPIGPLMREHRLIERMIALLETELRNIAGTGKIDDRFLESAIDFFRTYADVCHHGKEEAILFRKLGEKPLATEHRAMMQGLIEEHVFARNTVEGILGAKKLYQAGVGPTADIVDGIEALIRLYPKHIEKEDKHFFFPSLQYLSPDEQSSMLAEFREFDEKLVHRIYEKVIKEREEGRAEQ